MILLALDTSTDRSIAGLLTRSGRTYVASADSQRRHGRDLIPQIAGLLRQAALRPRDLEIVAVGVGPGSYTGLRVGMMAAKTLAYASGADLVGFDSLEAIAQNAATHAPSISVIADAQRGLLYVADYAQVAPGTLTGTWPTRIEAMNDWLATLTPGTSVIGPALQAPRVRVSLPSWLEQSVTDSNYPDATHLIKLARQKWELGQRDDPSLLEPRYLRRSAAEELWVSRPAPRVD